MRLKPEQLSSVRGKGVIQSAERRFTEFRAQVAALSPRRVERLFEDLAPGRACFVILVGCGLRPMRQSRVQRDDSARQPAQRVMT